MKRNKGISLIVLVITIIVMIILAGTIVLTLSNTGIIGNAEQAVTATNEAQVNQLVQLAWAEAYADGVRKVEDVGTTKGFQTRINEVLEANNIDASKYVIVVKENGAKAVYGWKQEGLTVKKGDQVLKIGDYIEYDETVNETEVGLNNVKWQVLGASEDGELLILSSNTVRKLSFGGENLDECKKDWLTAVEQLNEICKPYGKGRNAVEARSITMEDLNKITGNEPEYQEVTYLCNKGKVTVTIDGESNDVTGYYTDHILTYYDGEKFVEVDLETADNLTIKVKCITNYDNGSFINVGNLNIGLDEHREVFKMLFYDEDSEIAPPEQDRIYWLASPYAWNDGGIYEIYSVPYNAVDTYARILLYYSFDYTLDSFDEPGVRPVVALSAATNITGSTANGWTY